MPRWSEDDYEQFLAKARNGEVGAEPAGPEETPDPEEQADQAQSAQRVQREHQEQVQLIRLCRAKEAEYPALKLLMAIPNGGDRHQAVAAKLKAEGVQAGVPDLYLPVPRCGYAGLWIELKAPADELRGKPAGRIRKSQRRWLQALQEQGHRAEVAHGWEAAWAQLEGYLTEQLEWGPLYPPRSSVDDILRWTIAGALRNAPDKKEAADRLGIARRTLYNWIDKYNVTNSDHAD